MELASSSEAPFQLHLLLPITTATNADTSSDPPNWSLSIPPASSSSTTNLMCPRAPQWDSLIDAHATHLAPFPRLWALSCSSQQVISIKS
ncbi:hypothetical protein DPX16_22619 [Anabarilius grahami]|uniref:Uncharacterized protein n=1 Tax=Anabarilius grahami TaxID=495550 RepID=A0A3N0XGZ2_ANAGA|nr:hypothetical protein DPX16_22619 [Anabarilius grahami]